MELGGERNRKQRIPVNSITSKLVLKSIYASGSTGPFFADHYLNRLNSSFAKKNWLPVKITCYSCIIWNMICKKKKLLENRNGIFCQKFCNLLEIFEITEQELLLDSLLSAWTFVYWNMEVLLELLIIEIIFLQSKFTHSYCTNVEIFSVPLNSYVYFSKVYSGQVPGAMVLTACLLSRRCSLATTAFLLRCQLWPRQLFLFKTKLIICGSVAVSKSQKILAMPRREGGGSDPANFFCGFYSLKICENTGISRKMPGKGRPQSLWWSHFQMVGGKVLHFLVK